MRHELQSGKSCFRILSLDGGGIRGFFSAAFLAHIEEHTGKALSENFELIVGTSTGAIIALALASGQPANNILRFYETYGRDIFSTSVPLLNLVRPKYSNIKLIEAIRSILGDKTLDDLKVPVCIPSYELVEGCPRVFKDNHHPGLHWGGELPIWKVAAASSAAPVYFPAFQIDIADSHIDGGIWANNPVLVGIAEAERYFDRAISEMSVLSVGTGSEAFRLQHSPTRGTLGWIWQKRILNVVLAAQSQSAHYTAQMLLHPERYLRVDADLTSSIPLDGYRAAYSLIERGHQAGRRYKVEVERRFLKPFA